MKVQKEAQAKLTNELVTISQQIATHQQKLQSLSKLPVAVMPALQAAHSEATVAAQLDDKQKQQGEVKRQKELEVIAKQRARDREQKQRAVLDRELEKGNAIAENLRETLNERKVALENAKLEKKAAFAQEIANKEAALKTLFDACKKSETKNFDGNEPEFVEVLENFKKLIKEYHALEALIEGNPSASTHQFLNQLLH